MAVRLRMVWHTLQALMHQIRPEISAAKRMGLPRAAVASQLEGSQT